MECTYSKRKKRGPKPKTTKQLAKESFQKPIFAVKRARNANGTQERSRGIATADGALHANGDSNFLPKTRSRKNEKHNAPIRSAVEPKPKSKEPQGPQLNDFVINDKFVLAFKRHVQPMFAFYHIKFKTHFDLECLRDLSAIDDKAGDKYGLDILCAAFEYTVVLAHGARLCKDKERDKTFYKIAKALMQFLLIKREAQKNKHLIEQLFHTLLMWGWYLIGNGQFEDADICYGITYNALVKPEHNLNPSAIQCLHCMMVQTAHNNADRCNWFQLAEREISQASKHVPPANYVVLVLHFLLNTLVSAYLPKHKSGSVAQTEPEAHVDTTIYWKIIKYLEVCEKQLELYEATGNKNVFAIAQNSVPIYNDASFAEPDIFKGMKVLIQGCKAKAYGRVGMGQQASDLAIRAINAVKTQQIRVCLGVSIAIGFATQVSYDLGLYEYYTEGSNLLYAFALYYPVVLQIQESHSQRNMPPAIGFAKSDTDRREERQPDTSPARSRPGTDHAMEDPLTFSLDSEYANAIDVYGHPVNKRSSMEGQPTEMDASYKNSVPDASYYRNFM